MKDVDYPEEWDELPKRERKKKIKKLKKKKKERAKLLKKIKNIGIVVIIIAALFGGYRIATQKSSEEIEFEQEIEEASLEGRVEEFEIEGNQHIAPTENVDYNTNPPTSGPHLAQPEDWGVYDEELDDRAVVHSLEHGGIWLSYKDISEEDVAILEEIGKENSQSVVVSPRSANDAKIAVASWGKMMTLESPDKALIQKYIDTYKNQSPEKLAQ